MNSIHGRAAGFDPASLDDAATQQGPQNTARIWRHQLGFYPRVRHLLRHLTFPVNPQNPGLTGTGAAPVNPIHRPAPGAARPEAEVNDRHLPGQSPVTENDICV